jgi:hypothetical protein
MAVVGEGRRVLPRGAAAEKAVTEALGEKDNAKNGTNRRDKIIILVCQ